MTDRQKERMKEKNKKFVWLETIIINTGQGFYSTMYGFHDLWLNGLADCNGTILKCLYILFNRIIIWGQSISAHFMVIKT